MAEPTRKTRPDAWYAGLEEDQLSQLCDWLLTPGLSYKKVRELCVEEFPGVCPSNSQLSRFFTEFVGAELVARRRRAVTVSDEVAEDARREPGKFSEATIDALSQKAFELASSPFVNPKDVKAIFALVLKAEDQAHKREELAFSREKFEALQKQREAAQVALQKRHEPGSKDDAATREAILDEVDRIMGIKKI